MDVFQKLTIFTCVSSTVTLVVVCLAMLPHLKSGFVLIRDGVLWASFVIVVLGLIGLGVTRVTGGDLFRSSDSRPASTTAPAIGSRGEADPYYQGDYEN